LGWNQDTGNFQEARKTVLDRRTPSSNRNAGSERKQIANKRNAEKERATMTSTKRLFVSAIATIAVLLSTVSVRAEQADKYIKPHEPFTASGMQVRMSLVNPIDKAWQKRILPTVFQEIAPCRLSSTLTIDRYDTPWGGTSYRPNESRFYRSSGLLETPVFVDPCSEAIPIEAIGIVGRFTVTPGDGDGEIHIDSTRPDSPNATTVFKFKKGEVLMFEAGVLFGPNGTFGVNTWNAGADVMIDVLGYLLPDPAPAGEKGEKGDKGDQGSQGLQGNIGATGPKGEQGLAGVKGDTGAKGEQGLKGDTGAKGEQGLKGETGAKGEQGLKGDTGAKGEQGFKGDTGAKGEQGFKGDTGAKGEQGFKGDTGAKGEQGFKGDTGAKGQQGFKGDTGAKGEQGFKGDTGAKGEQGLKGETGAKGEQGFKGETGAKGEQGFKGETGAKGEQGLKGDTGAKGEQGLKGEIGAKGDSGPRGEIGPMGREGPAGPKGDKGDPGTGLTVSKGNACYPPGNNANNELTVFDASVTPWSVVILTYNDPGSNGNALSLVAQGNGFFRTTGSPNNCFQYAIFNMAR
jgi:hypothetical protein